LEAALAAKPRRVRREAFRWQSEEVTMASFNKVILMGNMTRDPQLKYLPNNMAVCEFGLAVNHRWRDKDGNQREDVCFVDLSAFGRQGEVINQYMSKGKPILVEGRLKYDTWTGQDGQKRSKHSVVVETFQFVGAREGGAPANQGQGGYSRPASGGGAPEQRGYDQRVPAGPVGQPSDDGPPPPGPADFPPPSDSDIPF
jgi:single-strand DNA-binding protein